MTAWVLMRLALGKGSPENMSSHTHEELNPVLCNSSSCLLLGREGEGQKFRFNKRKEKTVAQAGGY